MTAAADMKGLMAQAAPIDGKRLFYHYLQKDLQENDVWLFQMFTARLVVALHVIERRVGPRLCPVVGRLLPGDATARRRAGGCPA